MFDFSSSICQCKILLPCINAKRVVPCSAALLPTVLLLSATPPLSSSPSSLRPSGELNENKMEFFWELHSPLWSPQCPQLSPPPPLRPESKWSTPSCPLLRIGLPLRWWWLYLRRERRPSPSLHGSGTFLQSRHNGRGQSDCWASKFHKSGLVDARKPARMSHLNFKLLFSKDAYGWK